MGNLLRLLERRGEALAMDMLFSDVMQGSNDTLRNFGAFQPVNLRACSQTVFH